MNMHGIVLGCSVVVCVAELLYVLLVKLEK